MKTFIITQKGIPPQKAHRKIYIVKATIGLINIKTDHHTKCSGPI
jgi:hypothetical protein